MDTEDFTDLLKCIDTNKRKNILKRMKSKKFRVRGFNNLENIPIALIGGALNNQKKSSLVFLNEVCDEYQVQKYIQDEKKNFEDLKNAITPENAVGIIAYMLLNNSDYEKDALSLLEKVPQQNFTFPSQPINPQQNLSDTSKKKEERFRQKYLEQFEKNKALEKSITELQSEIKIYTQENVSLKSEVQKRDIYIGELKKQCEHEKDNSIYLSQQLTSAMQDLKTKQTEMDKKKVLALCSDGSITTCEEKFKVTYYDQTNIDQIRVLSNEYTEIWLINSEINSQAFVRKILKDNSLVGKLKRFGTPAELEKYMETR